MEIVRINTGITCLSAVVKNAKSLEKLNLHSNKISKIELNQVSQYAHCLRFLDLSSNDLSTMAGLSLLIRLEYLNLSNNLVSNTFYGFGCFMLESRLVRFQV
jgi:Leucine-rich repeat (LRR) protein